MYQAMQPSLSDISALASAWHEQRGNWMQVLTPRSLNATTQQRRPSCGSWSVHVGVNTETETRVYVQRLGELLRLASAAAPLGAEILRAVMEPESGHVCPHWSCAWCDGAYSQLTLELSLSGASERMAEILHDVLFVWDDTTATGEAFNALRDVLEAPQRTVPCSTSRRRQQLDLHVALHPFRHQEPLRDGVHTERLLRAMATPSCATTTTDTGHQFRVSHVVLDTACHLLDADDHACLLNALLHVPVPQSVASDLRWWPNASTLMAVCSANGRSLANVTRLDLTLDAGVMSDDSAMATLCNLLTAKSPRLTSLSVDAQRVDVSDDQHQRSIEMLSAALAAHARVESLRVSGWEVIDRRKRTVGQGLASTWSSLRTLEVMDAWSANALLDFVSKCPNLCELTVKMVKRADAAIDDASLAKAPSSSSLPVLTRLTIKRGWHPELLKLITRAGASLTHLRIAMPLDADGAELADTIARHCPSVSSLGVCDPDSAFSNAIAALCDGGRLQRLRQLSLYHYERPTMMYVDRTFTLACLRLLQVLSDPSRRLTQSLQTLDVSVPPRDYSVVEQAVNLMLRCNATIVDVGVALCQHSLHHDSDTNESTVYSHSESEDFDVWDDDAEDVDVGDVLNAMIASAVGKTAVPQHDVLPDVLLLPSLRCRLALLSVCTDRGIQLPSSLLQDVFAMAGRCARRHKIFDRQAS